MKTVGGHKGMTRFQIFQLNGFHVDLTGIHKPYKKRQQAPVLILRRTIVHPNNNILYVPVMQKEVMKRTGGDLAFSTGRSIVPYYGQRFQIVLVSSRNEASVGWTQ